MFLLNQFFGLGRKKEINFKHRTLIRINDRWLKESLQLNKVIANYSSLLCFCEAISPFNKWDCFAWVARGVKLAMTKTEF